MKISISWAFDHIDANWKTIEIEQLIDTFIKTTAEIETWQKVSVDVSKLSFSEIVSVHTDQTIVRSEEWSTEISLSARNDARPGEIFLISKNGTNYAWATMIDFGGSKELLLPAFGIDKNLQAGDWKETFNRDDVIIDIDNKSITHRPDLWGHRGMAREIAAMLNLSLLPLEQFVAKKEIAVFETQAPANPSNPFSISIQDSGACKRFAGLFFKEISNGPSLLWMAKRLASIDSRSINALIDFTNYIMFDIGQPMHAFDADTLQEKSIIVRRAKVQEKLALLDDDEIELGSEDLVIADGKKAVSLAGVMGGQNTGISRRTKSIFLESANFDSATIRRSSTRHKKRTESSVRFEKSLDPNQNTDAILRFLKLLEEAQIPYAAAEAIHSVGALVKTRIVDIAHTFIENRLGVQVLTKRVTKILKQLDFGVTTKDKNGDVLYSLTIPTFRATKDISIPEDIVEEIGRFFGYENIPQQLPKRQIHPFTLHTTYQRRAIKRLLSYGFQMHEVYNYSFYDESFLRLLGWQPDNVVSIKNPVSENYKRLVTSLQPHLFKAVHKNVDQFKQLRFFEFGRIWQLKSQEVHEQQTLSGILFDQVKGIDFYDAKALLERLFEMLAIPVSWQQVEDPSLPWLVPYQTVKIKNDQHEIGIAGIVNQSLVQRLCPSGGVFVFELNADVLLPHKPVLKQFEPTPKYPPVHRDISMLIPSKHTVAQLRSLISNIDERIDSITLIDFFTKPEWQNKKSLTFSLAIRDSEKTLTNKEVDAIWAKLIKQLEKLGATVR